MASKTVFYKIKTRLATSLCISDASSDYEIDETWSPSARKLNPRSKNPSSRSCLPHTLKQYGELQTLSPQQIYLLLQFVYFHCHFFHCDGILLIVEMLRKAVEKVPVTMWRLGVQCEQCWAVRCGAANAGVNRIGVL